MFPAIRTRIEQAVEKLEAELVSVKPRYTERHVDCLQESKKEAGGDASSEEVKKAEDAIMAGKKVISEGS